MITGGEHSAFTVARRNMLSSRALGLANLALLSLLVWHQLLSMPTLRAPSAREAPACETRDAHSQPSRPRLAGTAPPSAASYSSAPDHLKRVWRHPPHKSPKEVHNASWAFLDERQLARGLSSTGDPLRLGCLAEKLLEGRGVRLGILGGSVAFGTTFTTSRSRALFHWKVYQWLNASFPGAGHEHYSGSVPASGPAYMEHCLQWHVPEAGVDLILLEYAVNFDSAAEIESFERLLRRVLRLPGQPAVILVNTLELMPVERHSGHVGLAFEHADSAEASEVDRSFEYSVMAEDGIVDLAQYYALPCVSLRGALFAELKANRPEFPLKRLFHDRHHPAAWGHSLMAQMVVNLLTQSLRAAEARRSDAGRARGGACARLREEAARGDGAPWPFPDAPLISPVVEAQVGTCIKAQELEGVIASSSGFRYVVEGTDAKMKPGLVGLHPDDHVTFCIDVSRLGIGGKFIAFLGHLVSYAHMGVVRVRCEGKCGCEEREIDAHVQGGKFSVFKATEIEMRYQARRQPSQQTSGACDCALNLRILQRSGSGEHKFKVLSLMTTTNSERGNMRYGYQAGFNNRPMGARTSA